MQAENNLYPASGAAATAERAEKPTSFAPCEALPPSSSGANVEHTPSQPILNASLDGLHAPMQALLHAHRPLRFLLEQTWIALTPFAQILGLLPAHPRSTGGPSNQECNDARPT